MFFRYCSFKSLFWHMPWQYFFHQFFEKSIFISLVCAYVSCPCVAWHACGHRRTNCGSVNSDHQAWSSGTWVKQVPLLRLRPVLLHSETLSSGGQKAKSVNQQQQRRYCWLPCKAQQQLTLCLWLLLAHCSLAQHLLRCVYCSQVHRPRHRAGTLV